MSQDYSKPSPDEFSKLLQPLSAKLYEISVGCSIINLCCSGNSPNECISSTPEAMQRDCRYFFNFILDKYGCHLCLLSFISFFLVKLHRFCEGPGNGCESHCKCYHPNIQREVRRYVSICFIGNAQIVQYISIKHYVKGVKFHPKYLLFTFRILFENSFSDILCGSL